MKHAVWSAWVFAACGSSGSTMMMTSDAATGDAASPARLIAYVGGYGPDLAWLDFDPAHGTLAPIGSLPAAQPGPSFLALTATHLYAVSESASRVAAYAIDPATGGLTFINDVASGGSGPAHLSVDRGGRFVLVANYGSGQIAVLPIRADGGLTAAPASLLAGANAHMIVNDPSGHHVLVPCKGADYVAQYDFDPAAGTLSANTVPHAMTAAGAGPRHLAFAPDGAHAYLINENASTLTALAYDAATGRLTERQTVSTRAAGATGTNTGAEVWVHPSGNYVYGSNRGDDNIAVFAIAPASAGPDAGNVTLLGSVPTGGRTPRDFALDPSGAWLVATNQDSNSVTTFAIDAATGMPIATGRALTATMPTFVGFLALPGR